jgi:hypothetical protein
MASSRPIAAGEDYTPDDINNLRNDVLDPVGGHKHNGADGAKVPFSNLDVAGVSGSTPPTGGSKSYNDIANHVGGSQNVHYLGSNGHVLGSTTQGLVIQFGYESTGGGTTRDVVFPYAFATAPTVFVSLNITPGSQQDWPWSTGGGFRDVTTTKFTLRIGHDANNQGLLGASWMAIGRLA